MAAAKQYGETERTKKWMASVEANLESATGKSLAEWIKIAQKCPPGTYVSQVIWFREKYGIGQARSGLILERAFGTKIFGDTTPEQLIDGLFAKSFAAHRPLYEAIEKFVRTLDGVNVAPRKGYVAFYRNKQFAALKPSKGGLLVRLAMKAYPKSARLQPVKNLGGGDRTKFAVTIETAKDEDAELKSLVKAAWAEN
jgi:predicted transport protein